MPHRYVLKDAYWKMRIDHPYSMAAVSDDLVATCGQAPVGASGEVLHPGDFIAQSRQVIATEKRIFADLGIAAEDLTKVVIFTSAQDGDDLRNCERLFRLAALDGIPVYSVVIPPLFYDNLLLEVDFYAAPPRSEVGAAPMLQSVAVELDLEAGAAGFSAAQGDAVLAALTDALAGKELDLSNVAKLSCYAPVEETGFWEGLAVHRKAWFKTGLPAVSDVVSAPRGGKSRLQLDATCVAGASDTLLIQPLGEQTDRGHPEAVTVGPLLFTSALFAPAGASPPPSSVTAEVTSIMDRHAALLQSAGLSFADVIKANTFYEGAGSASALHENMQARNAYYRVPGPASTGLPVSAFPYAGKRTSIELIAARA